ncbi:hypothetical protein A7Q18_23505, partial [Salmonella enterica subsp. enterica serovar Cerro]|nr:hypothetical protein [Salmonella enterica subsp. enterica serovar Cerro]
PVFSGDGKVEMIGSDSEHEFPRCDGHVGRILRNNRCKKNRLVRSVFLLFRYRVGGPDRRKSLFN